MTNKEKFRALCDQEYSTEIPVFALPFWLDIVAEDWNVCIVEEQGKIVGLLPYCIKGSFIFKRIYLPDLSFYQSPLLINTAAKDEKSKTAIVEQLFQQLPRTIRAYFKFLPEYSMIDISNLGYQKVSYITYLIDSNNKTPVISQHHQRNIQKGISHNYSIRESRDVKKSYAIIKSTFDRRQQQIKTHESAFIELANLTTTKGNGKLIDCLDNNENLLASIFCVSDATTTYYLLSGYNKQYKNSGAVTFLLQHLIQESLANGKTFNFCGSSIESIANFFQGFGAEKVPVSIWKKKLI